MPAPIRKGETVDGSVQTEYCSPSLSTAVCACDGGDDRYFVADHDFAGGGLCILPNLVMNSVSSQNLQVLALFAGGVVIAGVRDSNNKFQSPKN